LRRFVDKPLTLSVYTDNEPAIHIYQKYGFRVIKTGYDVGYRPKLLHYAMQKDV